MTDTYGKAGEAIEEYRASKNHPGANGQWVNLSPKSGWHLDEEIWISAATEIVKIFNTKLPQDKNIQVPRSAKKNSWEPVLAEFRRYLATKADNLLQQPVIKKLEKN
jgi:hypothetical protein